MRALVLSALTACGLLAAGCASQGVKPSPPAPATAEARPAQVGPPPAAPLPAPNPAKSRCVPRAFPRAPRYPDTDQALKDAGGAADRYQLMAAGRLLRMRRLADLERIVEACR